MLGELVWLRMILIYLSYPWWWLVLFIEALALFANIEREGIPQRPNSKGYN